MAEKQKYVDCKQQLKELIGVAEAFLLEIERVDHIGSIILSALQKNRKILTCGNGGSATDALHLTEELVGRYSQDRKPLPSVCLSADVPTISCIANDFGYEKIFSRQVEALGQQGDVLVGFSTSGNSPNIIEAFQSADKLGISTIFLGGKDGGQAKDLVTNTVIVPSKNTARIQEIHTFILHSFLERIDDHYC